MNKSVIIVGAGISGLSAGCYSQMNGFNTTIFEMHNIPGGLCTAWKKKGYTFDISMHMVTGSVSGPFHTMWKELGVIDKFKFHFHKQMLQIEGMGEKLTYSTDRKTMQNQLLSISPEDEKLINNLYLSGQWTAPFTGTVIAALTGRQAIQLMCREEGRKFISKTG